jgi:signal transduction histidine kinase/tetratricopeptide (TPR) repeat protein
MVRAAKIAVALMLWIGLAAVAVGAEPQNWGAFDDLVDKAKATMMGDPAHALELARKAESVAAATPASPHKQQALATSLWLQSEALTRINQTDRARPVLDRGLELAADDGVDTKLDGDLNMSLARLAALTGDMELALKSYQKAHNIFAAISEARSQSMALQGLASIYGEARDYEHALEYYRRAASLYSGDPSVDMATANNLGNALKQLGRYGEALKDFHRALAIAAKIDSAHLQARVLTNIASVQAVGGDLGAAEKSADRALRLLRSDDPGGWSRFTWGVKAEVAYKRGALDSAVHDIAKAFDGVDLKMSTMPFREIHEIAYKIYRAKGDFVRALAHHEAFKRLNDQGQEVATTANLALLGARFDFAAQQLEIEQLKSEQLERTAKLAEADASRKFILLTSLLAIAALAISWIGWGYLSVKRHRNEINEANIKLQDTVNDLHDENERRRATETRLREAKDEAEHANRAKSQFLANMSHELRTPLNAINGFAQIMSQELLGAIGTPAYKQYAKDILSSGNHLFAILSDILDMARIDAGKVKLNETEFAIKDTIDDALRMFQEDVREAGKVLTFAGCSETIVLRADERLIRQILINLVSNAVKYTRDNGKVDVRVEVRAGAGLDLIVADNGIGIPTDKFDLIMEPFGQVEDAFSRSRGGIGLGLPLVRSLAELHGGSFTLESDIGRGTTARIRLPADRVVSTSGAGRPSAQSA